MPEAKGWSVGQEDCGHIVAIDRELEKDCYDRYIGLYASATVSGRSQKARVIDI